MSDKSKQKKQETTEYQTNYNDGWCVVSQKKQNDKENSENANFGKESVPSNTVANKNVVVVNKVQKNINQSQDSIINEEKNGEIQQYSIANQSELKKNNENNNDSNSVTSKCDETSSSAQIAPTDKFNQFRERLNEQTKRYYYFDKQFFKIYNCQQINGLDSNQIIKLKDESSQIFQDLRNIILSYINYNGGIIFFGFNHIKRENFPHMEVNGFDITKNDHKKYVQLQKTLETIVSRITPSKIKYDLSIMKVRKDKNQDKFTQEKYVARIIVQQGQDLRTLYVYKEPNSSTEPITAKYSKKDFKFITMKGSGLTQAAEQKKQLTKVKDLIYTHIDDFDDPQSSYANIKNSKNKSLTDNKKGGEDQNDSDDESNKSEDNDFDEDNSKSNGSDTFQNAQDRQSEQSNNEQYQDQLALVKEPSKKQQSQNTATTNKESTEVSSYLDVGQWNTELPTDKQLVNEKGKSQDNNQYNVSLSSQQQDDDNFPQINSFRQKSSSQIDQTDSQSSSSNIPYQEQIMYNAVKQPQEQKAQLINSNNNTNLYNQVLNQQANIQNMQKIIYPKQMGNQNNILQSGSQSQTPELLNQQAILYQQQQQLLQNMYKQASINQVIPNQHQNTSNLVNFYKPIDCTIPQQQSQILHQPTAVLPNPHQYQVPVYLQYPTSQSNTPIPYQNQNDYLNNPINYESKLNNSLKTLSQTELNEMRIFLEEQVRNYSDYLSLIRIEDYRRKIEVQQNNPLIQNMHGLNQNALNMQYLNSNNAPNFSNPHSNTSLSN